MRDLRDVLTALEDRPSAYRDALDELEADLRARAQADGRDFQWIVRGETDRVLNARNRANLTRALRESMTNALKHGSGTIVYEFEVGSTALRAVVTNEAADDEPIEVGMGIDNIRSRLTELGGTASYSRSGGLFQLTLTLPWRQEP
jgi:signal transduction histidine kinase